MSPITPSVQCKHFSISCSASAAIPEYLPLHPALLVSECVLIVDISHKPQQYSLYWEHCHNKPGSTRQMNSKCCDYEWSAK